MTGPVEDKNIRAAQVELVISNSTQHNTEVLQDGEAAMPGTSKDKKLSEVKLDVKEVSIATTTGKEENGLDVKAVNIPTIGKEENGIDLDASNSAQMDSRRHAGGKRKAPRLGTSRLCKRRLGLEPATKLATLEYSEKPDADAYIQELKQRSNNQKLSDNERKALQETEAVVEYFSKHPELSQSDSIQLSKAMRQSFFVRQSEILKNVNFSIKKVMSYFPGLRVFEQVICEFKRWMLLQEVEMNSFQKEMGRLLAEEYTHHAGCEQHFCMEAKAILDSADEGDAQKKTAQMILYLCFITNGEWRKEMVKFPNGLDNAAQGMKARAQPTIQLSFKDGKDIYASACAEVTCENVKILESLDLYSAVFAVYYLYYCFNLQYKPMDEKIFKLFDTALEVAKRAKPIADAEKNGLH